MTRAQKQYFVFRITRLCHSRFHKHRLLNQFIEDLAKVGFQDESKSRKSETPS